MLCIDNILEPPPVWAPVEFRVRAACQDWERREAFALRRAVFCIEQGIFTGDDRDSIDDASHLLVAMSCRGGMPDQVVGTVRIHEKSAGLWWGSRLAVHPSFRSQGHLGATLIRLAVSRAHALGCHTFLAHVQAQNVPLFRRLKWQPLAELSIHGRAHCEMQADLTAYPPCFDPVSGYVTRARGSL
jgi:putative N-acetyltransferase (TIGR04045 family)